MRLAGADSVKSPKYTPMIVRSSPAANILDILVDIQNTKLVDILDIQIFCKIA